GAVVLSLVESSDAGAPKHGGAEIETKGATVVLAFLEDELGGAIETGRAVHVNGLDLKAAQNALGNSRLPCAGAVDTIAEERERDGLVAGDGDRGVFQRLIDEFR